MPPYPATKSRSSQLSRLLALALLGAALAVPSAQGANGAAQVHASCAGDVLSGTVRGRSVPGGELELTLLSKRSPKSAFARTGKSAWVDAYRGGSYPFSFNIGQFSASAYRVDPPGGRGNVVTAASCAPGHQVPEAPLSLLLPLSVLGLGACVIGRRRRLGPET